IKDAEVLESLERVNTLIVDKTGTLTEGRPKLSRCIPTTEYDEDELLRLAASVEQNSEHPLARSVVEGARERAVKLSSVADFNSVTGGGVHGSVEGKSVLIGKRLLLKEKAVSGLDQLESEADEMQSQGSTVIYVAINQTFAGLIAVSDPIKASTPEAV